MGLIMKKTTLLRILLVIFTLCPALGYSMKRRNTVRSVRKHGGLSKRQAKIASRVLPKHKTQQMVDRQLKIASDRRSVGTAEEEKYNQQFEGQSTTKSPAFIDKWVHGQKTRRLRGVLKKIITVKLKKQLADSKFHAFAAYLNDLLNKADRRMLLGCMKKNGRLRSIVYWIEDFVTIERFQKFLDRANRKFQT